MKIEDKSIAIVDFINIDVGEVFADTVNTVGEHYHYLKINMSKLTSNEFNAVRLENGDLFSFSQRDTVLKLNAKVVIE